MRNIEKQKTAFMAAVACIILAETEPQSKYSNTKNKQMRKFANTEFERDLLAGIGFIWEIPIIH